MTILYKTRLMTRRRSDPYAFPRIRAAARLVLAGHDAPYIARKLELDEQRTTELVRDLQWFKRNGMGRWPEP